MTKILTTPLRQALNVAQRRKTVPKNRNYETILVNVDGPIGIITINRPQVLNALSFKVMEELVDTLESFDGEENIRAILLTGGERVFSAGADIKEMANMTMVQFLLEKRFALWERIRKIAKPIIAAISGYCVGGGLELAMNCDIIIASENARFGQPEINIGVMPGAGGTQRLTRTVGKHRAMQLILTGATVDAQEAFRLGIVSKVVPRELFLEESKKVAFEIASRAPIAIRLAKESILKAFDTTVEVGAAYERSNFYILLATEDKTEGMRAFFEKRTPQFKGR